MIEIQALKTGTAVVRVLTLSSGRVNALDVEVLEALAGSVRELQDSGNGPLVITGAGRVFSAGVDLNRVVDGGTGAKFLQTLKSFIEEPASMLL